MRVSQDKRFVKIYIMKRHTKWRGSRMRNQQANHKGESWEHSKNNKPSGNRSQKEHTGRGEGGGNLLSGMAG